jgi:hypothetical protein
VPVKASPFFFELFATSNVPSFPSEAALIYKFYDVERAGHWLFFSTLALSYLSGKQPFIQIAALVN